MLKHLLFYIYIGLSLYSKSLASQKRVQVGDFFVENIEVVTPKNVQINTQEIEFIKKIAALPEKTNLKLPNTQLFQSASNQLFLQGYVVNIKIIPLENKKSIKLQIRLIQKLKKIAHITWEGIKKSEEKKLLTIIPYKKNTFLIPYQKKDTLTIIETYFKQKGFPHIQAKIKKTSIADNQINLCFMIEKGTKVYIRKVIFEGNNCLSDQELKRQILYTKPEIKKFKHLLKKLLTWHIGVEGIAHLKHFFMGTILIEDKLKQDIHHIKKYYHTKGFVNVAITYKIIYDKKGHANILLKLTEGHQYKIGQVIWKGNIICESPELNKFLGLKPGDIFDAIHLQKKLYGYKINNGVKNFYEKKGYSLASFDIKYYKNKDNRIDLVIQLQEQLQPVINKIVIHKDLPINFNIKKVLEQNGLQKGKVITHKKLENAYNSLIHTGLFVPEKITLIPYQKEGNKIDLICNLSVQRPQIAFNIALGGGDGGLYIGVPNVDIKKLLLRKKPCVGSQKLLLQFNQNLPRIIKPWQLSKDFSDPKRKFAISFENIFNPFYNPIRLKFDLFLAPKKKDLQNEVEKGLTVNMSTKWGGVTDFSELCPILGLHFTDLKNIQLASSLPSYSGKIKQCIIGASYIKHNVNDLFYPTEGKKLSIELKKSFNLSKANSFGNYWRVLGSYSQYIKISTSHTRKHQVPLAIKSQTSAGLSSLHATSPMGRFFLGSRDSEYLDGSLDRHYVGIRGYDSKNTLVTGLGQTYTGSSFFFMQNIEIRHALAESIPSYGLLFVDFACASHTFQNLFSTYAISLGIGFRTKTPLGILGFELAWPCVGKKNWLPKFHFSFGSQL